MTDTPALYAIYDTASRKIVQLAASATVPDLSALPALAAQPIGAAPAASVTGSMFDAAFNIVPYVPTLSENQRAKSAAASAWQAGLIAAGFTWSGSLFQIDADSRTNIAAMGIMALGSITDPANSPWPSGFYWVAADNSHVAMDAPTMYAFGRAVAAYVSACVLRLRAIKDAIAAAPDQATLAAIDVTAGYPPASA
jgi:hypothetical protein